MNCLGIDDAKDKPYDRSERSCGCWYGRVLPGSLTGASGERPGHRLWETRMKSPSVTCAITANVALGQSKETEGESESDLSWALARKSLDLWTKEPLAVWFPLRLLSDCVRDWRWCDLLNSLGFAFGVLHSYISKNWLQLRCLLAFFLLNLHIAEKICIYFFFPLSLFASTASYRNYICKTLKELG